MDAFSSDEHGFTDYRRMLFSPTIDGGFVQSLEMNAFFNG
jgi:hypothetical protein